MATKKDLVEAYSFSRRRLVTAFVSGAPGGREVEPARPGRAVIGGIAIAVLLLAGAAVLNILDAPVELDETAEQLISEKESGADYVLISTAGDDELELRPVVNITSAMLLLGAGIEPRVVPREELGGLAPGEQIGILQAPATPPPVDRLIGSGWTACTTAVDGEERGVRVDVAEQPAVEATPGVSFVVRTTDRVDGADGADGADGEDRDEGDLYLVAETTRGAADGRPRAYAYAVPGDADAVLGAVASSSTVEAVPVAADWLPVFPQGAALELATFGLDRRDLGDDLPGRPDDGPLARAEVGDVLEVGEQSYLLTAAGTALQLDAFAEAVYLGVVPGGREPIVGDAASLAELEVDGSGVLDAARWPSLPTSEAPNGGLCALLTSAPGTTPSVVLARAEPGGSASAEDVDPGAPVASVAPGAGAFVRSGGWADEEAPTRVLVDDRGFAYGVAGAEETERLGYAAVPAAVVPDSWLDLFLPGVPLSIDAARCPPTSQQRPPPCD